MPIKISKDLPAYSVLSKQNIFVMSEDRAFTQDIRPLQVIILNLMPKKIETENQILRYLSNTPIQVEVTLLNTSTHVGKNVSYEHLQRFYSDFDDIKHRRFDALIITGAPVEKLEFDKVDYWDELSKVMEWSKTNVYSTLYICWAAFAGLYYHYDIKKYNLERKLSGIYKHWANFKNNEITRGLDDVFYAPHSRYATVHRCDVAKVSDLNILAESSEAGPFIIASYDMRKIFITGHLEYERDTLKNEYYRDIDKGLAPHIPINYFPNDDPSLKPIFSWSSTANIVFSNWLNYSVYQNTDYDWC